MGTQELLEVLGPQGIRDKVAQLVPMVQQEIKGSQAWLDRQAQRAHKVQLVRKAIQDCKALQVTLAQLVPLEIQALQGRTVLLVHKELRALRAIQERLEAQELQAPQGQ